MRRALCATAALTPGCGFGGGESGSGPDEEVLALYEPAYDVPPAEPAPGDPPPECAYPDGPYGTQDGDMFAPFELPDCDGRMFYFESLLCDPAARLVLFNVGAGWCEPCIEETAAMVESGFDTAHASDGLRIVQALFQDDDAGRATRTFCGQWRDEFGMSFPVLVDPEFKTEQYFGVGGFDRQATPINVLIDRAGVVRYSAAGENPADIEDYVEALLAEAEK